MSNTFTLVANAKYGFEGKQFCARITGRHPRFTFEREFVGRKSGKRGEQTEAVVDDPGLYMERDIDSKGRKEDTFWLCWNDGENFRALLLSLEEAMEEAKALDSREGVGSSYFFAVGVRLTLKDLEVALQVVEDQILGCSTEKLEDPYAVRVTRSRLGLVPGLEGPYLTLVQWRDSLLGEKSRLQELVLGVLS